MPTYALFNSIDLFFRHPSKSSFNDMKTICNQNHPMKILLSFQYKLNKTDSTYYKHLKLFDFKSDFANLLKKKFEGVLSKLMFCYLCCQAISTKNTGDPMKHMEETANSILTLIREQRREVPNMLTPEIIIHHLHGLITENYYADVAYFLNECKIERNCSSPAAVSFL